MTRSSVGEAGISVAGRFRLVARIGQGSIGEVWSAEDGQARATVAVKLVAFEDEHTREQRFIREVKATMRLRSPHVVHVVDAGIATIDGERAGYIALELLEGETLASCLRRERRLPADETLRIFEQVGRAVSLAHSVGLVHRDLKPSNIFICDDGAVKTLDFGLAKSFGAPLTFAEDTLTRVGDMIGTPLYMSPEQARGSAATDHRTDLWAIGVMVFECLTGERLFFANTLGELKDQLEEAPIVVPSSITEVPQGFDAWFERAVDRDVQARFQSASALIAGLRRVLAPARTQLLPHALLDVTAHTGVRTAGSEERTVRRITAVPDTDHDALLADIDRAFAAHTRVVTLCGQQGVGRRAAALGYAMRHGSGAWVCSLASATDADAMWRRIASALGVVIDEDAPATGVGLAARMLGRALVVFDGVERVRPHVGKVIAELLRHAPQASVLVTSDAPLEVATERVLPIRGVPPVMLLSELEDDAREALLQAACFRAPFTVASAEQVVTGVSLPVSELIAALCESGWLRWDGQRASMPPALRKLCNEELVRTHKERALEPVARHGAWFSRNGEDTAVDALLRRGGAEVWRGALDDAEDVAAALDRAKKRKAPEIAARCGRALGVVEAELGRHGLAARLFLAAMSSVDPSDPLFTAIAIHRVRALIATHRASAAVQLAVRIALEDPPSEPRVRARAWLALAEARVADGSPGAAWDTVAEARRACADIDIVADANLLAGRMRGDEELLTSAAAAFHTLGERRREAEALETLGRFDDALALHRRLGARLSVARVLARRGSTNDLEEAAALLAELGVVT